MTRSRRPELTATDELAPVYGPEAYSNCSGEKHVTASCHRNLTIQHHFSSASTERKAIEVTRY